MGLLFIYYIYIHQYFFLLGFSFQQYHFPHMVTRLKKIRWSQHKFHLRLLKIPLAHNISFECWRRYSPHPPIEHTLILAEEINLSSWEERNSLTYTRQRKRWGLSSQQRLLHQLWHPHDGQHREVGPKERECNLVPQKLRLFHNSSFHNGSTPQQFLLTYFLLNFIYYLKLCIRPLVT